MKRDLALDDYIAGSKTRADWLELRPRLVPGAADGWKEAFTEYFRRRLELRYLHPIQVLQENGTFSGEGFSIVAIQCTLIEFLESTAQGTNYRYARRGATLGSYEYSSSQDVFTAFLRNRQPFSTIFDAPSAQDFYVGVRCGLLHEARTKNGWRVWAESEDGRAVDVGARIVFRDDFQRGLLAYVQNYGEQLQNDPLLQAALIRKFDHLCA